MRNFDWIFDANGKVSKGKACIFDREPRNSNDYDYPKPGVVTLSGEYPYYTDGRRDPLPDEVDSDCWIELNEYPDGDCQKSLYDLFEILPADLQKGLYDGYMWNIFGKYINRYGDEMLILVKEDDFPLFDNHTECVIIDATEIEEHKSPYDLNEEEQKTLFNEIRRGSFYYSDYKNSVGCTFEEALSWSDSYYAWLNEEFGDEADYHDNLESWLNYAGF